MSPRSQGSVWCHVLHPPLLRFGRAEVLLPQSMATGLQNTFFFCCIFFLYIYDFFFDFFKFIVWKMVQYSIMIHTFLDYSTMKATKVDKHYIFFLKTHLFLVLE